MTWSKGLPKNSLDDSIMDEFMIDWVIQGQLFLLKKYCFIFRKKKKKFLNINLVMSKLNFIKKN